MSDLEKNRFPMNRDRNAPRRFRGALKDRFMCPNPHCDHQIFVQSLAAENAQNYRNYWEDRFEFIDWKLYERLYRASPLLPSIEEIPPVEFEGQLETEILNL